MTFTAIARRHAAFATGLMGWSCDAFWRATPAEWLLAWRVWAPAHGISLDTSALGSDVLEHLQNRFPDGTYR